jgi:hypothetical protein
MLFFLSKIAFGYLGFVVKRIEAVEQQNPNIQKQSLKGKIA